MLNRAFRQPGPDFFHRTMGGMVNQFEAVLDAQSIDDRFLRVEALGLMLRLDPAVVPTAFHCAMISEGEREALRLIRNIVRMGRVERIDKNQVVLAHGDFAPRRDSLYIDYSASDKCHSRPLKPLVADNRIGLQMVRFCQPLFRASFICHIEASLSDKTEKNCVRSPVPLPQVSADWLRVRLRNVSHGQSGGEADCP